MALRKSKVCKAPNLPPAANASEDDIQEAVVELLSIYERQGLLRFHATPNGGSRHPREAANMKRRGVRAGVSDICVMIAHGPTLWIELKSAKGKVTGEQLKFMAWANTNGHLAWVARSADEVDAIVKPHLVRRAA